MTIFPAHVNGLFLRERLVQKAGVTEIRYQNYIPSASVGLLLKEKQLF